MDTEERKEDLSSNLTIEDSKKMKPPSKKKFDEEMETFQNQIKELEMKYEPFKTSFSEMKSLEGERKAIIEHRKSLFLELEKLNKNIPEKMRRLNELKSSLVYKSEDKINKAISRLEWNLSAKTFKLTEEKKIVSEIDRLKRSKKTLVHYMALEYEVNGIRDRQREIREERDRSSRAITSLKSREDSMRQHHHKSKALKDEIDKLYEQKRQLVASFKRQKEDFKDVKDKQRKESMKKKEEERRASFHAKRKERAEMETDKLLHEGELHLCQTLMTYLSRLNPTLAHDLAHESLSPASSQAAEDPEPAEEMDDGQYVLLRKSDDVDDLELSICLGRNRRKNRRSRKQSMVKKITHSTDVLSQFMTLNLNAPSSLQEVSEALVELKKKKAFFESEQQTVESTSDTGFSQTESMMCEMSRQASRTESCEGGSQENVNPDDSILLDLLSASREKDRADGNKNFLSSEVEFLGAVGGVAPDTEWSDSATPKSDSQNSDSTVEGDQGDSFGNGNPVLAVAVVSSSSPVAKKAGEETIEGRRMNSSARTSSLSSFSAPTTPSWSEIASLNSPSGQKFLSVPKPDNLLSSNRIEPSLPVHKPLQKTQSLQPPFSHSSLSTANTDIKSYAHSVIGRAKSFSSAVSSSKPQAGSIPQRRQTFSKHTPPSSLSLAVPLTASLNLPSPTKRPLSRSKTMTPTESSPRREIAARHHLKDDCSKSKSCASKNFYSKDKSVKKPVSTTPSTPSTPRSHPHPTKSPLSPRHSCPLPSNTPTFSHTASASSTTVLDQDFPPLSQTANSLRQSSNLSSISSNGSQSCLDHSHESTSKIPVAASKPSSSEPSNSTAQQLNVSWPQMAQDSLHISGKKKSETELWVESSIAYVHEEVVVTETSEHSLRESTRL